MTRISKLYATATTNPGGLSFREFERLLDAFGFVHRRTTGSHRHYTHHAVPVILTVLPDGKDVKRYQVRRLLDIVDQYGLSLVE